MGKGFLLSWQEVLCRDPTRQAAGKVLCEGRAAGLWSLPYLLVPSGPGHQPFPFCDHFSCTLGLG